LKRFLFTASNVQGCIQVTTRGLRKQASRVICGLLDLQVTSAISAAVSGCLQLSAVSTLTALVYKQHRQAKSNQTFTDVNS